MKCVGVWVCGGGSCRSGLQPRSPGGYAIRHMLVVDDIHTYYGDSHILQGISLEVGPGEAVGLLGRNGAGKSTTIKSVIGFTPPRRGRVLFRGVEITRLPSYRIAQMGVGLVPQGRGIFPTLSVRENIALAARAPSARSRAASGVSAAPAWTFERVLEVFPPLGKRLNNSGAQLSGGEQQMLAVARALMTNPHVLLLDEPSEGLAPLIVAEIGRIIAQLRDQGMAILLVEQNLALALRLATRIYVMSKGRIVWSGPPDALRENEEVKHRYLGV
jgi:branched-chain amino acid transport system ATP-binding protein